MFQVRNVLRLETNKQNKRNDKCAWWNNSEYLRELSISLSKKWWHLNITGVDIARGILLDSASGSQQKKRNQSLMVNSCQVNKADAGKAREFKKRCCCEGTKQHHSGYLVLQGCAADVGQLLSKVAWEMKSQFRLEHLSLLPSWLGSV